MFQLVKDLRILCSAVLAMLLATAAANAAGLVGYRNDTNQAVVVQSSVTSNGRTSVSKPQTLYSGEVALDNLAFVGTRRITVYDAKTKAVLFQGDVTNSDDAFYSIQSKASVNLPIKGQTQPPAAAPKYELVKVQNPTMPKPGKPSTPTQPNQPNQPTKKK